MPYPLNSVNTLDAYDDTRTTLIPPRPTDKINIIIENNAALVSMERCDGMRVGGGVMLPEEYKPTGVYGITREFPIGRVRFRSATPGVPAKVSASAAV